MSLPISNTKMTGKKDVKRALTTKEMTTLFGLIQFPGYKDRELADALGLKLSTVTAIRRRLRQANYYHTVRFPMVQHLGCEIITFAYGKLNQIMDKDTKNKLLDEYATTVNNAFLICSSDDICFIVCIDKNYTDVKRNITTLQRFLSTNNLLSDDSWMYALFPFEVSKILNLFDFSPVLSRLFDQGHIKSIDLSLGYEDTTHVQLSNKEKTVFRGLVDNPELPDNAIAKKVGVSRQALSNMRKKFEAEGLIVELNIPNLYKIGLEIIVLSHVFFHPKSLMEERRKGIEILLKETPQFFTLTGSIESIMLHSVQNYDEFNFFKNRLLSIYTTEEFIRGEPRTILLPLSDLRIHKNFSFGSIVQNALE